MKFFLLFLALSFNAHAFTLNNTQNLRFASDKVKVNIASNCQNLNFTNEELLNIVETGVDSFWNTVSTSRLKLEKGAIVNVSNAFYTEDICQSSPNGCDPNPNLKVASGILIACNTSAGNFSSNNVLATTVPNNISGATINGALIVLNDNVNSELTNKNAYELRSIFAHEIGHAFGLGHTSINDALMFYATMDKRVALGKDDIDGITYLYPSEQPKLLSCGSVDLNSNNHPNWWGGFLVGLGLVFLFSTAKKLTRSTTLS